MNHTTGITPPKKENGEKREPKEKTNSRRKIKR
jgi:hypothetical protein